MIWWLLSGLLAVYLWDCNVIEAINAVKWHWFMLCTLNKNKLHKSTAWLLYWITLNSVEQHYITDECDHNTEHHVGCDQKYIRRLSTCTLITQ